MLEMTGRNDDETAARFANPDSSEYAEMVSRVNSALHLTSLRYQRLDDCVKAIGLPKTKLCTYCWDGCEGKCGSCCAAKKK